MSNPLQDAVDIWGRETQLDMAIEECAELIQAIEKLRRKVVKPGYDRIVQLHAEIADVSLVIDQLRQMFPADYAKLRQDRLVKLAHLLEEPVAALKEGK